ncbi:MAG: bifunctional homocysteine S-methyltransferase/methylenetetrahydrofolate reductase [Chloroflexota bacterium]
MTSTPFLERIRTGAPLLGDGAMGTLLHARGNLPLDACFEALNLDDPDLVAGIHREYAEAGADIIETNTFGANTYKLTEYGLGHRVEAVNKAAVELARWAVARRSNVYVVGAVGPLGVRMAPFGKLSKTDARAAFTTQLSALADAGVDAFLFETFTDHGELLEAMAAARVVAPDIPVVAHMTFNGDDRTLLGYLPGRVADELHRAGADVIGVNCSGGPAQITRILEQMRRSVPDAIYSALPNAGFPENIGGRVLYHAGADYFADAALDIRRTGATIIGGCCGTTPEHIAAMRVALDDPAREAVSVAIAEPETDEADETTVKQPTELAYRLANGQFTITVEMTPPRSYNMEKTIKNAAILRDAGAHLLDIADSPAAKMRMSPWAMCQVLQSEVGLETILHFPTRGRNLLRVQGDLLASHALGLRNLFVTMGDPTKIGDYPDAADNFDIAPSALIGVISQQMNAGQDIAGNSIGGATSFTVGCALNMFADDLDRELRVLEKKLNAGASFALGQAVFRPELIEVFHTKYEERFGEGFKLPVLMGIMPLYSLKQARYLHNEVPGINIPDHIFKRLEDAGDDAPAEGVKIAQEILGAVKDKVAGAYIIPALGRYHLAAEVVDSVRVPTG